MSNRPPAAKSRDTFLNELRQACPHVAPEALEDFMVRMDEAYFRGRGLEEVALHVKMADGLGPDHGARVHVTPLERGCYEVVVVALDCFGMFSMLCGLLGAHHLSIESGDVHTFGPHRPSPDDPPAHVASPHGGSPRRAAPAGTRGRRRSVPSTKIVDILRVVPRPGRPAPDAPRLEAELVALLKRVADGQALEAREQLNRQIVESLEGERGELVRAVPPVEIEFDNQAAAGWTLMRVRGKDSPAFLYSLGSALALRGVYVHSVRIESVGDEVRDEFAVSHRDGRKIEGADDQQTLRLAVVLIKQFTHFLPAAPDPARALRSFDQLLDRAMSTGASPEALALFRGEEGLRSLALLLGSSVFLWEDFLRRHFEHLSPVLAEWRTRPLLDRVGLGHELSRRLGEVQSWEDRRTRLNEFKDEEMLLIDMKHLLDPKVSVTLFSEALSDLAEAVLDAALRLCRDRRASTEGEPALPTGSPCAVAVVGLGKLGGRELGYASDLELLVVYEGAGHTRNSGVENGTFFEVVVQDLTEAIEAREEGIFHLDLRLRPHGKKGPLASPLALIENYYRPGGDAHPLERQAMVKLRFIAGDGAFGRRVEAVRDRYVWSGEPWDRAEALRLRERQVTELVPPGRFNVKLSRGALVDVEYAAQYLQIQHGREHVALRTPHTLDALAALATLGFLSASEHEVLREGYLFWRRVTDALRMVRGHASDLLLPDEGGEEARLLARRLGYSGQGWSEAAAALDADIDRHRLGVRSVFDRLVAPS